MSKRHNSAAPWSAPLIAALACIFATAPASADLLCTMPNGIVITQRLGDCPKDAVLVRKPSGEVVRANKPPPQPTATTRQPNAPAQPTQPSAYDMAQKACVAFRQVGASQCKVDTSMFSTSTIQTTMHMAPQMALVTCRDVAATLSQASNAFRGASWEIQIFSPFSGDRPIAACPI